MRIPLFSRLMPGWGPETRRCRHVHSDGGACKATPQREREYCFFHDPGLRERRKVASGSGGAHSRRRKRGRLEKATDLGEFLLRLINEVYSGEVDVRVGNSLARLTPLLLRLKDSMVEQEQEKHAANPAEAVLERLFGDTNPASASASASTGTTDIKSGNLAFRQECDSVFRAPDAAKNENPEERKKIDEERHPTEQQVTPHEIGQTHRTDIASGDMARKKFDEQELAIRKETAHALAPTTMKYSTFHEQGFVVAKEPDTPRELSPERPVPVRDPDNEPSPISGLLNRHLNYLKFAGMPVSELQRRGLIPSRWKSKFVRRW